jgi:hypothetical protein
MAPIKKTIKPPAPKIPPVTKTAPVLRPGTFAPTLGKAPPAGP